MKPKSADRMRGVPAKALTSLGYSICFFPEQPTRKVVQQTDPASLLSEKPKRNFFQDPDPISVSPVLPKQDLEKPKHEAEEDLHKTTAKKTEHEFLRKLSEQLSDEVIRLHWRNRLLYLIAFTAFSLSLNNIFHFPMSTHRYGLMFFIPYTLATILIGYPMHALETSMGQYSQRGSLWVWSCAPLFFGTGCAMLASCVVTSLYYNIFSAYSLVYFAHSFSKVLPWTYCSEIVWEKDKTCAPPSWYISKNASLPSKDYFYNVILNTPSRSVSEVWEPGSLKWWLFLSFLFSWVLVYVATLRSSRSIEKMASVVVVFSYFGMLALLVVAVQVKSSGNLIPRKMEETVFDVKMWYTAVVQVLLELGICHGIPVVYGSYCRFNNSFHIDSIILCIVNYLNSVIFFFLFFWFFGSLSCDHENSISDLPDITVGVVYMVYSEAFSSLPGSHLWCAIFFFILFLTTINTQIAIAEAIMAAVYDNYVKLSRHRSLINLIICTTFFSLGIIFCFSNGYFGATTLHYIPPFFTSIPLSGMFLVGIVCVYGFDAYSDIVESMLNLGLSGAIHIFVYFIIFIFVGFTLVLLLSINTNVFRGDSLLYPETYTTIAWPVCIVIIIPFILCIIVWKIYCWRTERDINEPLQLWERLEEKNKTIAHINSKYYSSYTCEWNRYE